MPLISDVRRGRWGSCLVIVPGAVHAVRRHERGKHDGSKGASMKRVTMLGLCLLMACSLGCQREATREQADQVMAKADGLRAGGDVDGAVRLLEKTTAAKAFQPFRADLTLRIVQTLMSTNRLESAGKRVERAAVESPDTAGPACGFYMQELYRRQKYDDAARWCREMAGLKLPEGLLAETARFHLEVLRVGGKAGEMGTALASYLPLLSAGAAQRLAGGEARILIHSGEFDAVNGMLAVLDQRQSSSMDWKALACSLRMEMLVTKNQWPEAADLVRQSAGELPDGLASSLLNDFLGRCASARKTDVSEGLCRLVLNSLPDKPLCREAAASAWVGSAEAAGDPALAVRRLQELTTLKIAAPALIRLTEGVYPIVIQSATNVDVRAFVDLCGSLLPQAASDAERTTLKMSMMDGNFRLEDYAGVLKILEAGLPDQPKTWQDAMISKVKAHLALKEGRNQEAVEGFQKFMQYIESESLDQTDPLTGGRVTKEAILGLNAKRIGEIFASMGDQEHARKSYATARDKYREALERARSDTNEFLRVQQDAKKVPAE